MSRRGRRAAAERRRAAAQPAAASEPTVDRVASSEDVSADAAVSPATAATATADGPAWVALVDRHFLLIGLAIVGLAAVLRLLDLGATPMHNDEGVNGFFVTRLVRQGEWVYDPANYHGPTLFYLALVAEILFGLTTEAMRLVPAIFGIGVVALALGLRPFIGSIAALVAAALLALSPGMAYISRYFIHEMLLVFFTLAIVVSLLWYLRDGRERFLLAAAVALAGHFATKETGVISIGVLAIALVVGELYVRFRVGEQPGRAVGTGRKRRPSPSEGDWRAILAARFTPERLVTAALAFGVVHVLLFTSFGTNLDGVLDSFATFTIWTQTGGETQTQPLYQYLAWMARPEIHILVLGTLGGLLAAWQGSNRIHVFIGLWALGITMAYSLISYKTPWVAINMIVPLAILGGIFVSYFVVTVRSSRLQVLGAAGLAGLLSAGAYQTVDLSFRHHDDETYGYVFVHTVRDMYGLIAEAERVAAQDEGNGIAVFLPEYWPLPWYWRDHPNAVFWGNVVVTEEAVILANINQDEAVTEMLGDRYVRGNVYTLRPGVDVAVWIRSDLHPG